jgi:hypothetical protein
LDLFHYRPPEIWAEILLGKIRLAKDQCAQQILVDMYNYLVIRVLPVSSDYTAFYKDFSRL